MKTKLSLLLSLAIVCSSSLVKAQEQNPGKSSLFIGGGICSFYRSSEVLEGNKYYNFLPGMVFTGEILMPAKFSKNVSYVAGGIYIAPHDTYAGSGDNYVSLGGGGVYGGMNATIPFIDGDFKAGLFAQVDIGAYTLNYHYSAVTADDATFSSLGSELKGGLMCKIKSVSIQPYACFQFIGSQKSGNSLIGSFYGLRIGFDI